MSTSKALLRPLSKSVYYAEAIKPRPVNGSSPPQDRDEPELIVCFGWMDAQLKHVDKYISSYQRIFPTSSILLLQSSQSAFYSPSTSLNVRQSFSPAVDLIRKFSQSGQKAMGKESNVLVHVFSNGGCMSLKWLNQALIDKELQTSSTTTTTSTSKDHSEGESQPLLDQTKTTMKPLLPARAIIFDSCPGKSSLLVTMRAFSAPIRNRWIRLPTMGILAILHGIISITNLILRKQPILNRLYNYLNSPTSLPLVPRLYIYSKIDQLIPHRDVEQHARIAREELEIETVKLERFEESLHVGHARVDPERYWNAVERLWRESGTIVQKKED